jgi:hypothetical protein
LCVTLVIYQESLLLMVKYLSHCSTKSCILHKRNLRVSSVCSQEVTACFVSVSVTSSVSGRYCWGGSKGMEIAGLPFLLQSLRCCQWFGSLQISYEEPGLQTVCDGCQCEASCHFLATETQHQFLSCQDTSLGTVVRQMLKHQWWDCGGLMCTIFYPCAVCIVYNEVTFIFLVTDCLMPYFCESQFVSHICLHFSLPQAGIQHELFIVHLTPQACKWQFLPVHPQCCLKCNVTWNQYTTVLTGGKFKYSVVAVCNNCCLVLLTECRN